MYYADCRLQSLGLKFISICVQCIIILNHQIPTTVHFGYDFLVYQVLMKNLFSLKTWIKAFIHNFFFLISDFNLNFKNESYTRIHHIHFISIKAISSIFDISFPIRKCSPIDVVFQKPMNKYTCMYLSYYYTYNLRIWMDPFYIQNMSGIIVWYTYKTSTYSIHIEAHTAPSFPPLFLFYVYQI